MNPAASLPWATQLFLKTITRETSFLYCKLKNTRRAITYSFDHDDANNVDYYDTAIKEQQVVAATGVEPPAHRMGLIDPHGEVYVSLSLSCNLVVQCHKTTLQPQVIPIKAPEHHRRDKSNSQEDNLRLNGRKCG